MPQSRDVLTSCNVVRLWLVSTRQAAEHSHLALPFSVLLSLPLTVLFPFPSYLFIIITTIIPSLDVNPSPSPSLLPFPINPSLSTFNLFPSLFTLIPILPNSLPLLYYIIIGFPILLCLPFPSLPLHSCFAAFRSNNYPYYSLPFPIIIPSPSLYRLTKKHQTFLSDA